MRTAVYPQIPAQPKAISPATWDWRVPPSRGDTDPDTARRARRMRIRWRLANPDEWKAHLEGLSHFDPGYTYDEGHEYESDWTSDPDYPLEHRREYDKDGFLMPPHSWHAPYISCILLALEALFGRSGLRFTVSEPELHFDTETSRTLFLLTDGGNLKTQVSPDVAVLPTEADYVKHRVLRTDLGEAIPSMVIEVVSPTSVERDRDEKFRLYASLGITEYLLVDLGNSDDPPQESDLRLELFRLQENGTYALRGEADGGPPYRSIHSHICGTDLRIGPPRDNVPFPVFQWYDTEQECWRDTWSDERAEGRTEGHVEGHVEGQMELTLKLLNRFLPAEADRDRIAEHWSVSGLPDNVDDLILDVQADPERWSDILGLAFDNIEEDSKPPTPSLM